MFEHVTVKYIRFIKQFLVNRIFSKYIKLVNTNENLMNEFNNEKIWNEIMNKEYIIFNYYMLLVNETDQIPTNEFNLFKQETYQEYIDRKINKNSICKYDYNQFIINMKDETYNNNMIEKYNKSQKIRKLKNHIIYIVKLYIKKKITPTIFMTDEEEYEVDTFLDMTSYFEYIRKNNWLDYSECSNEETINKFERDSIIIIGDSLYN